MPAPRSRLALVAALAAASFALAGCSILSDITGITPPTERDESGAVTQANEASDVFEILVGDCLNDFESGDVSNVPQVPCVEEHQYEVYANVMVEGADYPGEDAIYTAGDECATDRWTAFVGVSYEESALDFTTLDPSAESWAQGDREILCLILDPAGTVAGTLEGAAR